MDKIKSIWCAIFGHTRVETAFWGYHCCARCGTQVGDTLGSVYPGANDSVIVGHKCEMCVNNYKKLKWHEKVFTPNPFGEKNGE